MRLIIYFFILNSSILQAQSYRPNILIAFQNDFYIGQTLSNQVFGYFEFVETDYYYKRKVFYGLGPKLSVDAPFYVTRSNNIKLGARGGIALEGLLDNGGITYEMCGITDASLYFRKNIGETNQSFLLQFGAEYNFNNIYFENYWMPYFIYELELNKNFGVALKFGLQNKKLKYVNISNGEIKPSHKVYSFGASLIYYIFD